MTKRHLQNFYIGFILLLTISLLFIYILTFSIDSIMTFLFWCAIAIIAESFLIISPSGVSTSVGVAIYIYIAIMANPLVVLLVTTIGFICRFPEDNGVKKHIFNTKKSTSLFNIANIGLSMGLSSFVFQFYKGEFNLLVIIPLVILALIIAESVNFLLLSTLLKITQDIQYMVVFKGMLSTFGSTLAIGTLGIFLAFADVKYGKEIVLLFFVPLLLARYSFKLYFDSQRMALDTIHALNEALHAKDAYTGGHTGRVEQYSVDLAKAYGLPISDVEIIRTAALLHDIGKIGIPDQILNKPGRLTNDEYSKIKEHSSIGAKILGNVDSLKKVSHIIVQHHERYDGTGYPGNLKGDEISIEAAILMISDSFDAMTTDRPYRGALSKKEAIEELSKYSGSQFHPMLTHCFIENVLLSTPFEMKDELVHQHNIKEHNMKRA